MNMKKITNFSSARELAFSMFYYASGSILGPLLIFGSLGYLIDSLFRTSPLFILIGVLVAFIVTNILLFKKVKKINSLMESYRQKKPLEPKKAEETALEEDK